MKHDQVKCVFVPSPALAFTNTDKNWDQCSEIREDGIQVLKIPAGRNIELTGNFPIFSCKHQERSKFNEFPISSKKLGEQF